MENKILLDTHTFLWFLEASSELSKKVITHVSRASRNGGLLLASISLWEIATLESYGRIVLEKPVLSWFAKALQVPGLSVVELSPEICLESTQFSKTMLNDPADRMIVATALVHDATLATRDEKMHALARKMKRLRVLDV